MIDKVELELVSAHCTLYRTLSTLFVTFLLVVYVSAHNDLTARLSKRVILRPK